LRYQEDVKYTPGNIISDENTFFLKSIVKNKNLSFHHSQTIPSFTHKNISLVCYIRSQIFTFQCSLHSLFILHLIVVMQIRNVNLTQISRNNSSNNLIPFSAYTQIKKIPLPNLNGMSGSVGNLGANANGWNPWCRTLLRGSLYRKRRDKFK
jgi:hypothetical protein